MEKKTPDFSEKEQETEFPDLSHIENYLPNDSSKPDFSQIIKNNPSGWIIRPNMTEKTGGLYHSRTAANDDSLGQGIPGRIKMGRKVAYPVQNVVKFLEQKYRVVADAE